MTMTDLIRRADAIEAIVNSKSKVTYHDASETVLYGSAFRQNEIIDILSALPSAEATTGDYPNDLISRSALMEYCSNQKSKSIDNNDIARFPSVEAVQGEWGHMIADGSDGSHWYEYECSHCGEVVLRPYNFCPNCGTMMYKGGDTE